MRHFITLMLLCSILFAASNTPTTPAYAQEPTLTPPIGDALIPPPPPPSLTTDSDTYRGPSQFLAGHVSVRVILPESNGSRDASLENWHPEQIRQIEREVRAALDWWADMLPKANLRFTVELAVVPTMYEPIMYGLQNEHLWISDTLQALGFRGGTYFDQAYAAAFALRDQHKADWATTIFIVNSDQSSSGYFRDGYFAYAYIGGPFMVLTSDVGAYGASKMAPIVAHELGHVFGALDQYAAARVPCTARSGYLNTPTTNSQYGNCGTNLPSIMLEPVGAFVNRQIDPSALAQVGYRDSSGDGVLDPLTTTPHIELIEIMNIAASHRPRLAGIAMDVAFPAPAQIPASINRLTAIEYRVDTSAWQHIPAADGAFDSQSERFEVELPLYDGEYQLELRAVNSVGRVSATLSRRLLVEGVGVQPSYTLEAPTTVRAPQVRLQIVAPIGTTAVQISRDPLFSDAAWQPVQPQMLISLPAEDAVHTFYVRFRDAAGLDSLAFAAPVALDTTPPTGTVRFDAQHQHLILDVTDNVSGVAQIELQSAHGDPIWMPFSPTIDVTGLTAPFSLRFSDYAGNISTVHSAATQTQIFLPLVSR